MAVSDTSLNPTNIWRMFWDEYNKPILQFKHDILRLRSANNNVINNSVCVFADVGALSPKESYIQYSVRPVFQIDLSKIEWN